MSKSKSKDLDSGLAPEKLPTPPGVPLVETEELFSAAPAAGIKLMQVTTRLDLVEGLLLLLEEKCVHGGTVGLDEVRAVLAKLREGA